MPGDPYRPPGGKALIVKLSITMAICEWCKQDSDQLSPLRDWEEALTGPEYHVCPRCVQKHQEGFEAASAEWAAYMEPSYRHDAQNDP